MSKPVVSAIIPCYNGELHIGQAIEHLLQQSRPADELIVVDDGSTDRSPDIIQSFPDIQLIRHEHNRGLPTGRNSALKAAQGDILVYVDVDAYADQDLIAQLIKAYDSDDIAAVGGAGYEVRSDTTANRWRKKFLAQNYGPERREDVPFLFGICASFRKAILQSVGGFDPLFTTNGEDVDLSIRLRQKGYRLVYVPEAKVLHHRHDTAGSLLSMIYRWWLWGHRAHLKNGVPYFRKHVLETLSMTRHVMYRALVEKEPGFLPINLLFFKVALVAIIVAEMKSFPRT